MLAQVPRCGLPIVMHDDPSKTADGKAKPARLYSASGMEKLVQRSRERAKLPGLLPSMRAATAA